jgi:predicted kinase
MELVIFIGAQGAGKSTFYRQRFADTHLRINLDMLKTRHRERRLVETCFAIGQRFVVDNTNPTAKHRNRYIQAARDAGFTVVGYRFDTAFQSLIERNAAREEAMRVPEGAIKATLKRLEEPSLEEGFDSLFRVTALDNGEFAIARLYDEIR